MPTTIRPALLDHAAQKVVHAFDGCLLVPVRPGLALDGVHLPLAPEIASDAYWARLATDSIAVVLGPRSGGLFAVKFDGEMEFQAFLQRNPVSRHTLITRHAGHPMVWHRAETAHRVSLHLPGFAVLLVGNELVLDRGGLDRKDIIFNNAAPSRVNLETVNWGSDATGAVAVWLSTALWTIPRRTAIA